MAHEPTPKGITNRLSTEHGVTGTAGIRRGLEMQYYEFHRQVNGVKLPRKFRPGGRVYT